MQMIEKDTQETLAPQLWGIKRKIKNLIVLIDCNNFFVSCERVFDPILEKRATVVLSSNDGCVVSRSNEAKKAGIPMGEPAFKCEELFSRHNVAVRSSNFALYADMSKRVMDVLCERYESVEIYSIDEAFVEIPYATVEKLKQEFTKLRADIKRWTGIPVSIGIAPTKTLAKVCSEKAKKNEQYGGVAVLEELGAFPDCLKTIEVSDIWGIGWSSSKKLKSNNIFSGYDLIQLHDKVIRKLLTISGLKTVTELRGIPCIDFVVEEKPRKGIVSSQSFGKPVKTLEELSEAVAQFATRASTKLRAQNCVAEYVSVYIRTNRFNEADEHYSQVATVALEAPTNYIPALVSAANQALNKIFRPGYGYKKAAVFIQGIEPLVGYQQSMYSFRDDSPQSKKQEQLMKAIETVNSRWGRSTMKILATGTGRERAWHSKKELISPAYTTKWTDLLTIKV